MAYKAVITDISDVTTDGTVTVRWDFCDDDTILNGGEAVSASPASVRDIIRGKATEFALAWDAKAGLTVGEIIDWQ